MISLRHSFMKQEMRDWEERMQRILASAGGLASFLEAKPPKLDYYAEMKMDGAGC